MQNRIKIFAGVMLASAVIGGCAKKDTDEKEDSAKAAAPAPAAFDKKAAEAEIRAGDQVFFSGVKAKDAEVLAGTYSNDAVSMPANSPPLKGHDAIKKFNEDFLKLPQASMVGATDDVAFSDDGTLAYATGHYSASWADAKGKKVAEDGKYLNVLKKVDGKWKVVADAFSGNAAPKM